MKKLFKPALIILYICSAIAILAIGVYYGGGKNEHPLTSPTNLEEVNVSDSALTSNSYSVAQIVTDDTLVSYLQINKPKESAYSENSYSFTTLTIKQTIGDTTYIVNKDECGNVCYITQTTTPYPSTTAYYFTRPAKYTIIYSYENKDYQLIHNTEEIEFAPSINQEYAKSINGIYSSQNKYFFLDHATYDIDYMSNLYNVSLETNSNALSLGGSTGDNCKLTIPDDCYGKTYLKFTSKHGYCYCKFEFVVATINFQYSYYPDDEYNIADEITKSNYQYDSTNANNYYIFNQAIGIKLYIGTNSKNPTGTFPLSTEECKECLDTFEFEILEKVRNDRNTADVESETKIHTLTKSENGDELYQFFTTRNNSYFHLKAKLKGDDTEYVTLSNLQNFKIMTAVPKVSDTQYAFALYLNQYAYEDQGNGENINYLSNCLSGQIPQNTIIYNSFVSALRVINLSNETMIINDTAKTIGEYTQVEPPTSNVAIKNNSNFDEAFSFQFIVNFISIGDMGSSASFGIVKNATQTGFSLNGNLPCPLYSRVTYNGTSYLNFYEFATDNGIENPTSINFTEPGKYTVELYTIPSYKMTKYYEKDLFEERYDAYKSFYYSMEFTVAGSYVSAHSGDETNIPNNGYSQSKVTYEVTLANGHSYDLFLNNQLVSSSTSSESKDVEQIGTHKIVLKNENGDIIKTFQFTILGSLYQGLSIPNHNNYASIAVSKITSELPRVLENLPATDVYHLLDASKYQVNIEYIDSLHFMANGNQESTPTLVPVRFDVNIVKSNFAILFAVGNAGDKISETVTVSSISGIELVRMDVFLNDKLIKTLDSASLASYDSLSSGEKSFSKNGNYTIRLTDIYGNTYEAQIEKYYKTNAALILLIVIASIALIYLAVVIFRARRRIGVK